MNSATTIDDVPPVGGKYASLGEMMRELAGKGVKVPDGFTITAEAPSFHPRSSERQGARRAHDKTWKNHGKRRGAALLRAC